MPAGNATARGTASPIRVERLYTLQVIAPGVPVLKHYNVPQEVNGDT